MSYIVLQEGWLQIYGARIHIISIVLHKSDVVPFRLCFVLCAGNNYISPSLYQSKVEHFKKSQQLHWRHVPNNIAGRRRRTKRNTAVTIYVPACLHVCGLQRYLNALDTFVCSSKNLPPP